MNESGREVCRDGHAVGLKSGDETSQCGQDHRTGDVVNRAFAKVEVVESFAQEGLEERATGCTQKHAQTYAEDGAEQADESRFDGDQ